MRSFLALSERLDSQLVSSRTRSAQAEYLVFIILNLPLDLATDRDRVNNPTKGTGRAKKRDQCSKDRHAVRRSFPEPSGRQRKR